MGYNHSSEGLPPHWIPNHPSVLLLKDQKPAPQPWQQMQYIENCQICHKENLLKMSERMKGSSPNHLPLLLVLGLGLPMSTSSQDNWSNQRGSAHSNWYPLLCRPQVFKVKLHPWIISVNSKSWGSTGNTPSRCQPCFVPRLSSCLLHHRPHWRPDPCAGWRAKNLRKSPGSWKSWPGLVNVYITMENHHV